MQKKLLNDIQSIKKVIYSKNAKFSKVNNTIELKTASEMLVDFGKESATGYTKFNVLSFEGDVYIKICYSDRLLICDLKEVKSRGDNEIDSATYLGVRLPVLPANPCRFNEFHIVRKGEYIYPLIEGQFRYMYISLIGNGSVKIQKLQNILTSKNDLLIGKFKSNDKNLNELFLISARTIDIATIKGNQVDFVNGKMLCRPLTKGSNKVVLNKELTKGDKVEITYHISNNPFLKSSLNLIVFDGESESTIKFNKESEGINKINIRYEDGNVVINNETYVNISSNYMLGFHMNNSDYFVVDEIKVNNKKIDLESSFDYFKCNWFLSDGAKRDRLPWSGDLEWAAKSLYYSFKPNLIKSTLDIMLDFQNSEGYIFACMYPEDKGKIGSKNYGLYESDIFSMWYIVVVYRYLQFTGDLEFVKSKYEILKKSLDYAIQYIGENGLFYQRPETSKGTWDNGLGKGSTSTYANILLCKCLEYFSEIASALSDSESRKYNSIEEKLHSQIESLLFNEEEGLYIKCLESNELDNEASSLALMLNFTGIDRAKLISKNYTKTVFIYGKILSLLIEGLYNYNLEEEGYKILTGHNEFNTSWGYSSFIDWYNLPNRDDCPHTTSECMLPPRIEGDDINCWGDMSHPDTAINHILCGCIAGIKPISFGFKKCEFNPHMYGLKNINVKIPTPYGDITLKVEKNKSIINYPKEIEIVNKARMEVQLYKY